MDTFVETLQTLGVYAGMMAGTIAAISKSPVGRFLMRALRREANALVLDACKEANAPLEQKLDALNHYTRYHLGPNSSAPAIHERIGNLERRNAEG